MLHQAVALQRCIVYMLYQVTVMFATTNSESGPVAAEYGLVFHSEMISVRPFQQCELVHVIICKPFLMLLDLKDIFLETLQLTVIVSGHGGEVKLRGNRINDVKHDSQHLYTHGYVEVV